MDYERSKNEDCGGWKKEVAIPCRSDSRTPGNLSDVATTMTLFNSRPGHIHWSRTFGERAASGAAHGAEEIEQVDRLFPLECRDAQQHLAVISPPEVQQQHFCIEADSLSLCCFIRSWAK